jgi:hypothetical protein
MATVPHLLTLTEIIGSLNSSEKTAFTAWPLADDFIAAVMAGNRDAIKAIANMAKQQNIFTNADANAIIALVDSQDGVPDPVSAGNWTANIDSVTQDGFVTIPKVTFTHKDGRVFQPDPPRGDDVDAARLSAWVKNQIARLDKRDAAAATIVIGPIS